MKGVTTSDFVAFKRLREIYESDVAEKNKEDGIKVTPTSYKMSIDRRFLRTFIAGEWIKAESVDKVTEEQLKSCIAKRSKSRDQELTMTFVDRTVRPVKMDMKIEDPEDRIWSLHSHYLTVLENAGLDDFVDKHPNIAIEHVLKRIQPQN